MSEDFTRALARVAVGQLAENAGYESVQESAVDVLSELMIKYITELSTTAHGYAELANRTSINIHDLLLGLDDVGTSVPELHAYLSSLTPEENTFVHSLADYPIRRPARSLPTWQDKQEDPPPHIPAFLPAFPDKHTYQSTPTYPGHEMNPDKQAKAQQKQRKQAETALLKQHQAMTKASKLNKPGPTGAGPGSSQAQAEAQPNPFLNPINNIVQVDPDAIRAQAAALQNGGDHSQPSTSQPLIKQEQVSAQEQQQRQQEGGDAGSGHAGAAAVSRVIKDTGAYEPHAIKQAFKSLLSSLAGGGGGGGGDIDMLGGGDDPRPPEELSWLDIQRQDDKGALKQPLGIGSDYTTATFQASHTYATGRAEEDAYEDAAKDAPTVGPGGNVRKRKTTYGNPMDPNKRKAQDVLDAAKAANLDAAEPMG